MSTIPKTEAGTGTEGAKPYGLPLTAEELSCLPFVMGGAFVAADAFGLAVIESEDDPVFDTGFRSLLVRGLVRLEGDDLGIVEDLAVLGRLLVDATDVWTLLVETAGPSLESFAFVRSDVASACIVPGPAGVFSYRPITTNLPREVAALLDLSSALEIEPGEGGELFTAAVQRLQPGELASVVVKAVAPGRFVILSSDGGPEVPGRQLPGELARLLGATALS